MRSIISIFGFTILLLLIGVLPGISQDKISGGSGGFYVGSKIYNTSHYNHFLEDGVNNLNNNLLQVGGGGYMIYRNIVFGGRGFYQGGETRNVSVGSPSQEFQNFTYSIQGGGGYLNIGYVVYSNRRLLVFPRLGFGYETLLLDKAVNENITFDPKKALSVEYRWGSPMVNFAGGIDWFPFKNKGAKIGLRIGYTISLQRNSDWLHEGGDYNGSNLPKNDLDGFYITIAIGGGGFSTQN